MASTITTLRQAIQRNGVTHIVRQAPLRLWRRVAKHRQWIFEAPVAVLKQAGTPVEAGLCIRVTEQHGVHHADDLTPYTEAFGSGFIEEYRRTLSSGAVLFTVVEGSRPVTVLWAKPAAQIKSWYVALMPGDVVFYGWYTVPSHRGKGLIGACIAAAAAYYESRGATRVLADVKVWNTPSIRAMERAGFKFLLETKPR